MRIKRRELTRREWSQITSSRPVARRIARSSGPNALGRRGEEGALLSYNTSRTAGPGRAVRGRLDRGNQAESEGRFRE